MCIIISADVLAEDYNVTSESRNVGWNNYATAVRNVTSFRCRAAAIPRRMTPSSRRSFAPHSWAADPIVTNNGGGGGRANEVWSSFLAAFVPDGRVSPEKRWQLRRRKTRGRHEFVMFSRETHTSMITIKQ